MALYAYEAFSREGKKVKGSVDAPSLQAVKDHLVRQGLYPISVILAHERKENFFLRLFQRGVSVKEKILFTKQLRILLKSGVQLVPAFELLLDQFEGKMHEILVIIKDNLKEGASLADSLRKFPKIFETIYIQLVKAGEASGNLERILARLTQYLERRELISKKVSSALRMPMIQLGVAILVVIVMLIFVVPQLSEVFASQGQELPGATKMLISMSNFMTDHYLLLIFTVLFAILGYQYWKATPSGAYKLDKLKLKIPLIKHLSKTNAVVQFSYTLGMLLEGGVHLPEALDVVVKIVDNRILSDALRQARDNIVKQGKIAQYLKQTNIFPPIAIYLIETGEQSGELDSMLLTVAQTYEEETLELTDRLTAALGPIMLLVMSVVIGFIVLSIILPITQMGNLAGI